MLCLRTVQGTKIFFFRLNEAGTYVISFDPGSDMRAVLGLWPQPVLLNSSAVQVFTTPMELKMLTSKHALAVRDISQLLPSAKYESLTAAMLRSKSISGLLELRVQIPAGEEPLMYFKTLAAAACAGCTISHDPISTSSSDIMQSVGVAVRAEDAESVLFNISALEIVQYLEIRPHYSTFNLWAVEIVASGSNNDDLMWAMNHTGEGEVIGVADTGLDMNSCFFRDNTVDAVFDTLNTEHRKVVYYATGYGDKTDGASGHGTHVSGTLAGSSASVLSGFNGVANRAKIAFFDIEDSNSGSLSVPYDLRNIFKPLYAAGARIFSNSWGNPNAGGYANMYTMDSREVDLFMKQYPDTLVLFAVGNNGLFGPNSVSSPSTNKNGLSVGATLNAHDSFGSPYPKSFNEHGIAYFSSIGPTYDNRLKPDILAPGIMNETTYICKPDCYSLTYKGGCYSRQSLVTLAVCQVWEVLQWQLLL